MSLADELLADLEDGDADDDAILMPPPSISSIPSSSGLPGNAQDQNNSATSSHEPMDVDFKLSSVREVAQLIDSESLKKVMHDIEKRSHELSSLRTKSQIDGPVESHPEYKLIVDANNMAVEIDNEINIIHKFVRDKYSKRFPELETLVPNALEYLMTVRELGNDLKRSKNNEKLQEFLTQATIMVLSVTASTTQGQLMSHQELSSTFEACEIAIELNDFKHRIYQFVESRMSFIAPNLSAIVGASIAAKLMGLAGGLTRLCKMPACNIEVLGSQRKLLSGFSSTAVMPHTGYVFFSDIVQNSPTDLRRKAARLMANKCAIAARVDASHSAADGSIGRDYRAKIEKALDKLQEPPSVKFVKPLIAPLDQPRKRRGGKRVRRMKERLQMTEMRKQANRMTFGEIEDDAYQDDLGFTTGQMGKTGTGRIRAPQIDEKTKVRISKTLHKNLQKYQTYGGQTTVKKQVSGTASSVAFTPLQGLEIVNPQAAEARASEANAKYFSTTSGFLSVRPK